MNTLLFLLQLVAYSWIFLILVQIIVYKPVMRKAYTGAKLSTYEGFIFRLKSPTLYLTLIVSIASILLSIAIVFVFLVSIAIKEHPISQVPTPSYSESAQPRCGLATLSILAAEVANINVSPDQWRLNSTNGTDTVDDLFTAWKRVTHRQAKQTDAISFNQPYFWVGQFQGGGHMCVCYFNSNSVTLKHGVYDPHTKTNYMVVWDYKTFFSNTIAVYQP